MEYRTERDTMGEVQVAAERLWGAQSERSRKNFRIGGELMPLQLIHFFARLKQGCATVNHALGKVEQEKKNIIVRVCGEILSGRLDRELIETLSQMSSMLGAKLRLVRC